MTQLLPKNIPTLQASSSRNWTRPDNVFGTEVTAEQVTSCETSPQDHRPNTDHLPILTQIDLSVLALSTTPSWNYRAVNWVKFNRRLKEELEALGPPRVLESETEFQASA
ncbi:hypothetical protein PISMIDRAFT_112780 [Pisolithus microcarpus 441]|uniref:Endonuclease/exonuclease/phosphatase domain-containing protein n=1 Tax=Pisolithus microcarpus 441 TaxID=765257 RepID=A0A0C9YS59_9AGAM|nr:hypothetical protein PISMIDRAFT_112780 [Pisolithus microcarpus 441]